MFSMSVCSTLFKILCVTVFIFLVKAQDKNVESYHDKLLDNLTQHMSAFYTEKSSISSFRNVKTFQSGKEVSRYRRNAFISKQTSKQKLIIESEEKPALNSTNIPQRPRFALTRNTNLPFDPQMYQCRDKQTVECQNKTKEFQHKILDEFKKSLAEIITEANYYNVPDLNPIRFKIYNSSSSICMLLAAGVKTLRQKDVPFNAHQIGEIIPRRKLFSRKLRDTRNCVIVSSAGSLANSNLGHFIDLHDIVMRFNHAPTKEYASDVGEKTTIRVVNSQVVSKPEYNFTHSPMFQNISLAAWDPGKFNESLINWFKSPDFNLFENYQKYMLKWPNANFHLVDPRSIWNLWNQLQIFTKKYEIRRNPPSSGFIGLALLLPICSYVDIIEYIPSTRLSGRCHYYDSEHNTGCTFGAWHPLAAEKLMTYDMNSANDFSVFQNGVIRIRRPKNNECETT